MHPILDAVRDRLTARNLDVRAAAREIGVTEQALRRHLDGGYARSDSLAKYNRWLQADAAGIGAPAPVYLDDSTGAGAEATAPYRRFRGLQPGRQRRVVDLFSGCGGLSLGFQSVHRGQAFRTVLAVDIEQPMIDVFNANHPRAPSGAAIARRVDLASLLNEAEVLAFYLDHLCTIESDVALVAELRNLAGVDLHAFRGAVAALDAEFLAGLAHLQTAPAFRAAYRAAGSQTFGQTSVIGFYSALHLPMPSRKTRSVAPLIWAAEGVGSAVAETVEEGRGVPDVPANLHVARRRELGRQWKSAVAALHERTTGRGQGQLASSAGRIARFVEFLDHASMRPIRDLWIDWRARRDALRMAVFQREDVLTALRRAYHAGREVGVVLGGPPCQGFSRIGRGKIRSLREDGVHVHADAGTGDVRNTLLLKYVLFVSALLPEAFLFENVRHFKTEVRTPEGTFLATELLAEAIREVGGAEARYEMGSRTILASDHLVPQSRDRYFMVGVRSDLAEPARQALDSASETAQWCLDLMTAAPLPLEVALDGLPTPHVLKGEGGASALRRPVTVEVLAGDASTTAGIYRQWIEQPSPTAAADGAPHTVDAHHVRATRRDDRELFRLMGPGRRWMDYRSDNAPTLNEIRGAVERLLELTPPDDREGHAERARVVALLEKLDGSLPIRLLLEGVEPLPGESTHHLLTHTYLAKREGNHGDWLSRLDAKRPCKTIVTHMGKDTYAYVHPTEPRTISVREAARVQTFPDWFTFGHVGLVDAYRVVGNAVPPLLSMQLGERVGHVIALADQAGAGAVERVAPVCGHDLVDAA